MKRINLEPSGQVVSICAEGFEPLRDYSGTPTYTREMTRQERRILRSYLPAGVMFHRVFACAGATLLTYFVFRGVYGLVGWTGFVPLDRYTMNVVRLYCLAGGFAVGLVAQWFAGRQAKQVLTAELSDLQDGTVLVQQFECRRVIEVTDINWDPRMGGRPWLVEVEQGGFVYLQGRYLDAARKRRLFPSASFEVVRAPKSGWGLLMQSASGEVRSTEEKEMWLAGDVVDGCYLAWPLEEIQDRLEARYGGENSNG